jgi:hypothetical protein
MVRDAARLVLARVTYSNVLATIALFIALSGGAYALTSVSSTGGIVKACAKKKSGVLRVVKKGKRCKKSERLISWNVRGQGSAGAVGAQGPAGPVGTPGAQGTPENVSLLSENWGSFGNPTWTNQPAALTELFGTTIGRVKADLTASAEVRLLANVAQVGSATAALRVQYSTDQASWNYLDGATGPAVNINTTGLKVSSWMALAAGAKADVFLRVVGVNGDATADPGFGNIILQVK